MLPRHRTTIRRDFYKLTRPGMYSGDCPHDRDISACEGTKVSKTEECPSRYSTHPFRKWTIVHQLDAGVSMALLSDHVDVSVPILEMHDDHRGGAEVSASTRGIGTRPAGVFGRLAAPWSHPQAKPHPRNCAAYDGWIQQGAIDGIDGRSPVVLAE